MRDRININLLEIHGAGADLNVLAKMKTLFLCGNFPNAHTNIGRPKLLILE